MRPYTGFASLYDELQRGVDYARWARRIDELARRFGTGAPKRVLELACGTGALTIELARLGYRVDGIDSSEEMLAAASAKRVPTSLKPRFFAMDMRTFDLGAVYDAAVSVCDGLNYVLTDEEMGAVLICVAKHLPPRGIFLADMSSRYKLEEVIGDRTIAESSERSAFIWENRIDRRTHMLDFRLTLFEQKPGSADFVRSVEDHRQRGYAAEEMIALARPWFDCAAVLDGESFEPANDRSERLMWVYQKRG